jgi:hypothetical protein
MTDLQKPGARAVINDWLRGRGNAARVVVIQRGDRLDPADRRADRDNLNDALRIAWGGAAQQTDEAPSTEGTYPWGSLSDDHQRDDGGGET